MRLLALQLIYPILKILGSILCSIVGSVQAIYGVEYGEANAKGILIYGVEYGDILLYLQISSSS